MVSPSVYIDKPIVLLPEDTELNNTTMKTEIMVVALGLACAGCQTTGTISEIAGPREMVQLVTDKAQTHQVPIELAHGVIRVESGYNPKALSRGNYGLGQIRCGTAKSVGFTGNCRDLLNPDVNLDYSMIYLRQALDRSNGDWCGAATLYNRGLDNRAKPSKYCRKVLAKLPN